MVTMFVKCSHNVRNLHHFPTALPKKSNELTGVNKKLGQPQESGGEVDISND